MPRAILNLQKLRKLMNQIRNNEERKAKINIKKFIQVLFSDIVNKAN